MPARRAHWRERRSTCCGFQGQEEKERTRETKLTSSDPREKLTTGSSMAGPDEQRGPCAGGTNGAKRNSCGEHAVSGASTPTPASAQRPHRTVLAVLLLPLLRSRPARVPHAPRRRGRLEVDNQARNLDTWLKVQSSGPNSRQRRAQSGRKERRARSPAEQPDSLDIPAETVYTRALVSSSRPTLLPAASRRPS